MQADEQTFDDREIFQRIGGQRSLFEWLDRPDGSVGRRNE